MQTCGANSEKLPTIPLIMMMVMTMITESETNWDLSLELTPHWWSFLLRLRLLIYRIRTFPQTDQIYVTWMNMVIITSRENYAIKIGIWIAVIKINPKLKFSALNLDRWLQGVTILTLLIGFGYSINGSDFSIRRKDSGLYKERLRSLHARFYCVTHTNQSMWIF